MEKLSEILSIYKENQVDDFLKKISNYDLNESSISYSDISINWKCLGNNESNGSSINMLGNGEKGLIERITNAVDAVIEKQFKLLELHSALCPDVVVEKAFPKYYETRSNVLNGSAEQLNVKDALDQVVVVVNDGSKSNKPTFDIIDNGTGIAGENFSNTILSISKGNKLSSDKNYLIGAFGQGGSTSLPFAYATLIVSKFEGKFYFTIIKSVEVNDYKNMAYVYLSDSGVIMEAENDIHDAGDYLSKFVNSDSGTLVRMIETDISKRFRINDVNKPGMLGDYINTQMFNVGFPLKIIDNRKDYALNQKTQNRQAYGSYLKLQTSSYLKKEYCGTIKIDHNNRTFKIEYFVVLPTDESKWGNDAAAKIVFEQFNVTYDPIIYTVNGQLISSEKYMKLANAGFNFLRYRLLIVIDLDVLGKEKYKFFTSNRDQIKDTDLTRGFLDKVVSALSTVDKLKEINRIIAEHSINEDVDQDMLKDVANKVKNQYNKFLKTGVLLPGIRGSGRKYFQEDEEIFGDEIEILDITSDADKFYRDQNISFTVTTHAKKHINEESMIYAYVDDFSETRFQKNSMNGRAQFVIPGNTIKPGFHEVNFSLFEPKLLIGSKKTFEVLDSITPIDEEKEATKDLDLKISIVNEATLIFDVSKNLIEKKIYVKLCLDTDELCSEVYGNSSSADLISKIKKDIMEPVILFGLFLGDSYANIDSDEEKNKIILSFIKALTITNISKE